MNDHHFPDLNDPRKLTAGELHAMGILEDLYWYFGYAEVACHRRGLLFLPSREAMRHAYESSHMLDVRERVRDLADSIGHALEGLERPHAMVLRTFFSSPPRWTRDLEPAFGTAAPLVLRIAATRNPWPNFGDHLEFEAAVAWDLLAEIDADPGRVEPLRREAQLLWAAAINAYARVNPRTPGPTA